jgi:hypothetical protein
MRHLSRITDPRAVLMLCLAALYSVVDLSTKALAPWLGRHRMKKPARSATRWTLDRIQAAGLPLSRFLPLGDGFYIPAIAGGMKLFSEEAQLAAGFVPINLATGANDGDWVSMKNYRHLAVIIFKGAGAAAEDPTVTMEQATNVAGSGAKALNFTTIYSKEGADLFTIGTFTKITQAAAATYTSATLGDNQALLVIEFNAEDLDVEGGFDCVRVRIADVGATSQIGAALYLLSGPRYAPPLSAIVD